jgi:hypothetical protein
MNKIVYTRADGGVSIVVPAPKEILERVLGPLTNEEYQQHVISRSIPSDATNVRSIEETDIPSDREFRGAWCDVTPESHIDIDLVSAKEVQLAKMRSIRNEKLKDTDGLMTRALELGIGIEEIKAQRQALRDITEPLKALEVSGYNNEAILAQIKFLGTLTVGA